MRLIYWKKMDRFNASVGRGTRIHGMRLNTGLGYLKDGFPVLTYLPLGISPCGMLMVTRLSAIPTIEEKNELWWDR